MIPLKSDSKKYLRNTKTNNDIGILTGERGHLDVYYISSKNDNVLFYLIA